MNYLDRINKQLRDKHSDQDIVPQILAEGEVCIDGEWILNSQLESRLGARGALLAKMNGHMEVEDGTDG